MSMDGHAALYEGQMVVVDRLLGLEEVTLVAELFCSFAHQVHKPFRGARLTLNVQILVADHVSQYEGLDAAQCAVTAPFRRQVTAAEGRVGCRPALKGFFAVKEDQPHRVAFELFAAQLVRNRHQQAGCCGTVVGAYEVDVTERVVRLVMRAEDDHAVFLPGKRTMKLCKVTGPMGVFAVKVSCSS